MEYSAVYEANPTAKPAQYTRLRAAMPNLNGKCGLLGIQSASVLLARSALSPFGASELRSDARCDAARLASNRGGSTSFSSPQAKCPQPSIDLPKGVLLPLLRAAVPKHVRFFDEAAHTCRPEAIRGIKLVGNETVACRAARA